MPDWVREITPLRYTEAQTRRWLAWLARGMQAHGQTVFLVEQLQPSWLPTDCDRWVYVLGTRSIVGLAYGLILTTATWSHYSSPVMALALLLYGLSFGIVIGYIDRIRMARAKHASRQRVWGDMDLALASVCCFVALVGVFLFRASFVWKQWADAGFSDAVINASVRGLRQVTGMAAFVLFPAMLSRELLSGKPTWTGDIQPVESLGWSWRQAFLGWAGGSAVAAVLLLLLIIASWFQRVLLYSVFSVVLSIPMGVPFGIFRGLTAGVRELKTVPNQGIWLSLRCATLAGLIGWTISVPVFYLLNLGVRLIIPETTAAPSHFFHLLGYGAVFGLALGLFTASWVGGLDVLYHYFLRFLLHRSGRAPLDLVGFLDYAAVDLKFLQKVGGGYMFIHRMLLEHFAAMDVDGVARDPQPSTPAIPASIELV